MIYTGLMLRFVLVVTPITAVIGLVMMLNDLHPNPGVAVVAFGAVAVISGATLGYFADRLPEMPRPHRPHPLTGARHGN